MGMTLSYYHAELLRHISKINQDTDISFKQNQNVVY